MSETEIRVAQAYLAAARQDPVAALIRSVRDLVRCGVLVCVDAPAPALEAAGTEAVETLAAM